MVLTFQRVLRDEANLMQVYCFFLLLFSLLLRFPPVAVVNPMMYDFLRSGGFVVFAVAEVITARRYIVIQARGVEMSH